MEAEFIAFAALGGSQLATANGVVFAEPGTLGGVDAVPDIDLPFGFLSLVGINLEVSRIDAGNQGVAAISWTNSKMSPGPGPTAEPIWPLAAASSLATGTVSRKATSLRRTTSVNSDLTIDDMTQIIDAGIAAANEVRAAIRLGANLQTGAPCRPHDVCDHRHAG